VCPQERLVIISYTTGLSFAQERIGPFAAIIITVFYLFVLYLLALPNTPKNPFASIYSESLIKTACQHLLLLVGFDTLIYRKYYDTPPILVGHQLAAVDFDLKFTYVLAGWEGSAHDASILNDSLNRPDGIQLREGKFYLGDAGYACRPGILPPSGKPGII
jgi:hypothetical protein